MITKKVFIGLIVVIIGIVITGALVYHYAPELQYPWGYFPNLVASVLGLVGTVLGLLAHTSGTLFNLR